MEVYIGISVESFNVDLDWEIKYKLSRYLIDSGRKSINITTEELINILKDLDIEKVAVSCEINYLERKAGRCDVDATLFEDTYGTIVRYR